MARDNGYKCKRAQYGKALQIMGLYTTMMIYPGMEKEMPVYTIQLYCLEQGSARTSSATFGRQGKWLYHVYDVTKQFSQMIQIDDNRGSSFSLRTFWLGLQMSGSAAVLQLV